MSAPIILTTCEECTWPMTEEYHGVLVCTNARCPEYTDTGAPTKRMSKSIALQIYEAVGEGYGYNGSQAQCIEVIETILNGIPKSEVGISDESIIKQARGKHNELWESQIDDVIREAIRLTREDERTLPDFAASLIDELISQHEMMVGFGENELPQWALDLIEAYKNA